MLSIKEFVNDLNAENYSAWNNQNLWMFGSAVFTVVAAGLMIQADSFNGVGAIIVNNSGLRAIGKDLADSLLIAWTTKSGVTALSKHGKRTTDNDYMAAKARVEEAKAATKAATPPPAPPVPAVVVVPPPAPAEPCPPEPAPEAAAEPSDPEPVTDGSAEGAEGKPKWVDGHPEAGVL
jgi:hypothetical protein